MLYSLVQIWNLATDVVAIDSPPSLVKDHVAVEGKPHAHGEIVVHTMCRKVAVQFSSALRQVEMLR